LVGYAGGTKDNPTYHDLGDHTESIQIEYDPTQISYEKLLELFWSIHTPTDQPWSKQYMSLLFYHDKEQEKFAQETMAKEATIQGTKIYTEIVPASTFYTAEMYHQKYYLQDEEPDLIRELMNDFSSFEAFISTTLAARLNGYVAGFDTLDSIKEELGKTKLSSTEQAKLMNYLQRM
jgi:peptide-methionine (S)-S-oxide reductase